MASSYLTTRYETTTLVAWDHARGLRADVIVPAARDEKVRVHWMRGVGTDADLDALRCAGRYLCEEGPHALSMKLDLGWTVSRP